MDKNKKAILWLSSGHFAKDIYTGILNPVMPFIAAKIGITMAMATVVISISSIFSSLLQPIFGFFADNILKRIFIFWGLILSSIFIPLAPLSQNIWMLIIFMILGWVMAKRYALSKEKNAQVERFLEYQRDGCVDDLSCEELLELEALKESLK